MCDLGFLGKQKLPLDDARRWVHLCVVGVFGILAWVCVVRAIVAGSGVVSSGMLDEPVRIVCAPCDTGVATCLTIFGLTMSCALHSK